MPLTSASGACAWGRSSAQLRTASDAGRCVGAVAVGEGVRAARVADVADVADSAEIANARASGPPDECGEEEEGRGMWEAQRCCTSDAEDEGSAQKSRCRGEECGGAECGCDKGAVAGESLKEGGTGESSVGMEATSAT